MASTPSSVSIDEKFGGPGWEKFVAELERMRKEMCRLTTRIYSHPSPSPAWLRTTSRRRRAGSRRLRRMLAAARRGGYERLPCW